MSRFTQAQELPLSGLVVIELSAIGPVPFAGHQLQQMGARVIRICPPEDRGIGIAIKRQNDLLNSHKEQRFLNLKDAADRASLLELLVNADVLLEGFRPGVMERLELDPQVLVHEFPRLIIGRLSGFGRQGSYAPRAGHDINYLGLSGVLCAIGSAEKPAIPLNLIADFGGGAMFLLTGVLSRLVQRSLKGSGGIIDTSILAGTFGLTGLVYALIADNQWSMHREHNLLDGGLPFYRVYKTRDNKFVAVGALEPAFFRNLLELTSLQCAFNASDQYDKSRWPSMTQALESAFASRSRDAWAADAIQLDCCVTPVLNFKEAACHPHNQSNGWINPSPFPHPGPVMQFEASAS
jgi:alpha-methylacyl-CoA racemase